MNCLNCNKETVNPKFCSRSCSASHTNKVQPKRLKQGVCQNCLNPTHRRSKFCHKCKHLGRLVKDCTLEEAIYHKHHKSSAYCLVRTRARAVAKLNNMNTCAKCGYSKHVEIAHIKSISSFPLTAKLSEINHIDNLKPLCPNCHWEFDH